MRYIIDSRYNDTRCDVQLKAMHSSINLITAGDKMYDVVRTVRDKHVTKIDGWKEVLMKLYNADNVFSKKLQSNSGVEEWLYVVREVTTIELQEASIPEEEWKSDVKVNEGTTEETIERKLQSNSVDTNPDANANAKDNNSSSNKDSSNKEDSILDDDT